MHQTRAPDRTIQRKAEPGKPAGGGAKKSKKDALRGMDFAAGEAALAPGAEKKPAGKKGELSRGSEGPEVEALQHKLKRISVEGQMDQEFLAEFDVGKVDGKYGARTVTAVKALQSNNQLPLTGVFDAATAAALDQEISFLDMMMSSE